MTWSTNNGVSGRVRVIGVLRENRSDHLVRSLRLCESLTLGGVHNADKSLSTSGSRIATAKVECGASAQSIPPRT